MKACRAGLDSVMIYCGTRITQALLLSGVINPLTSNFFHYYYYYYFYTLTSPPSPYPPPSSSLVIPPTKHTWLVCFTVRIALMLQSALRWEGLFRGQGISFHTVRSALSRDSYE